jgi:hypothetical protein
MDCMRHYCEKITQRNFNEKNYIKNRFNYKLFVQPEKQIEKKHDYTQLLFSPWIVPDVLQGYIQSSSLPR